MGKWYEKIFTQNQFIIPPVQCSLSFAGEFGLKGALGVQQERSKAQPFLASVFISNYGICLLQAKWSWTWKTFRFSSQPNCYTKLLLYHSCRCFILPHKLQCMCNSGQWVEGICGKLISNDPSTAEMIAILEAMKCIKEKAKATVWSSQICWWLIIISMERQRLKIDLLTSQKIARSCCRRDKWRSVQMWEIIILT